MTNGGGELNSFLKTAKNLGFRQIEVEFDLVECDRFMSLIILQNRNHFVDPYTFVADESSFINVPPNKKRLLVFKSGEDPQD
jgi:hypothetical protein